MDNAKDNPRYLPIELVEQLLQDHGEHEYKRGLEDGKRA